MSFPWTKNRVTRISQIVADLQSPKRGASLVVETGFPTSLIDLFVKNRTRFRNSRSKKQVHLEFSDPPPPPLSPDPPPPPELPETPTSSDSTVVCTEAPCSTQVTGNVNDEDGVSGPDPEANLVIECGNGSGSKTFLSVFLKVLTAIALVASVKKLTVGITLTAFALLFLEYAENHVVSFSNLNAKVINFLTRRISTCLWFQKLQLKKKNVYEGNNIVLGAECMFNSLSFNEIEVVGTKGEVEVSSEMECFEMQKDSNGNKVMDSCEISLCKTNGNRGVKFKSKMKKLVSKKLRCSRKEGKEIRGKESEGGLTREGSISTYKEDKSVCFEIQEKQKGEIENENSQEFRVEEVVVNNSEEEKRIDRVGNLGCVILFVISLLGLVVGRFPALILIVTWCFMLKIVSTRGRWNVS